MIVNQYIHELNNTEIGNTNTNETYVSVPRSLAPRIPFLAQGETVAIYKRNGLSYPIKFQSYGNGEFRITKLGPLYRAAHVNAGDLIQLEECEGILYVDFIIRKNLIVFACKKKSVFECLNEDRILHFLDKDLACWYEGSLSKFRITKGQSYQPRADSERVINAYSLVIGEAELSSMKDTLFNIFFVAGKTAISEARRDVICKLEWSNYE